MTETLRGQEITQALAERLAALEGKVMKFDETLNQHVRGVELRAQMLHSAMDLSSRMGGHSLAQILEFADTMAKYVLTGDRPCGKVPSVVAEDPLYGRSSAVVDLETPIDGRSMLEISRDALKAEMERK